MQLAAGNACVSAHQGTEHLCECTPGHGVPVQSAHQCVRMPAGVRWCVGTTVCAQGVGAPVRVHTVHRETGQCTPVRGSTCVRVSSHPVEAPSSPGGRTEVLKTGEPLGWPLSASPMGSRVADEVGSPPDSRGGGAACCGYSMRYWVLLPLWVGRVGGCPALGPQAALGCSGYTWQDCRAKPCKCALPTKH